MNFDAYLHFTFFYHKDKSNPKYWMDFFLIFLNNKISFLWSGGGDKKFFFNFWQ